MKNKSSIFLRTFHQLERVCKSYVHVLTRAQSALYPSLLMLHTRPMTQSHFQCLYLSCLNTVYNLLYVHEKCTIATRYVITWRNKNCYNKFCKKYVNKSLVWRPLLLWGGPPPTLCTTGPQHCEKKWRSMISNEYWTQKRELIKSCLHHKVLHQALIFF